jgi:hypothetical protein
MEKQMEFIAFSLHACNFGKAPHTRSSEAGGRASGVQNFHRDGTE